MTTVIPLRNTGMITVVSDEDAYLADLDWFAIERGGVWYASHTFYLEGKPIPTYLHHAILPDCPPNLVRDHENGCGLDNRRSNLRMVERRINILNVTKLTGVSHRVTTGKWRAYCSKDSKHQTLGSFKTRDEAIRARLQWEVDDHGGSPRREALYEEYGIVRK